MAFGPFGGAVVGAINHFAQAGVAVTLLDYFAYPIAGGLTSLVFKLAYDWITARINRKGPKP